MFFKLPFEQTHFKHIPSKPRLVFDNNDCHLVGIHFFQHFIQPRTVEQSAADPVIHEKASVGESVFFCVFGEEFSLVCYGIRLAIRSVIDR
jgi:hypothetical protein